MPKPGVVAIVAIVAVAVTYVFAFTIIGFVAEIVAIGAMAVLAGQLVARLSHTVRH